MKEDYVKTDGLKHETGNYAVQSTGPEVNKGNFSNMTIFPI